MIETSKSPKGSDWTRLLTDPDLVSHLGKLLQTYREVTPENRERALLLAMRQIKDAAAASRASADKAASPVAATYQAATHQGPTYQPATYQGPTYQGALTAPESIAETPPFEPDLFIEAESDRRRFQRVKCTVAVEIHVDSAAEPIWGNLVNVGRGGCMVETASAVPPGKTLEIGLWVANGKVWVKGVIISGVAAARVSPSFGLRVKFSEEELSQKEHLREFLKFVDSASRKSQSGKAYVAQLKR